jgi:hypothetical protein
MASLGRKVFFALLFWATLAGGNRAAADDTGAGAALPCPLRLNHFYSNRFHQGSAFDGFSGEQTIDGLPFNIFGQIELHGRRNNAPLIVKGIPVHLAFDELHLIHDVVWEDPVGVTVATIRLNYKGGGHHDFPIKYGVNVADWNRLLTEETETLDEPDNKIIRHYRGVNKGVGRLFKTVFRNPFPGKVVETIDLLAGHGWSAYHLMAATVAKSDPNRAFTPGLPLNDPPRHFDGEIKIKVLDERSGAPVANTYINAFGNINGEGIVFPPLQTDAHGEAVLRYPVSETSNLGFSPYKDGYINRSGWSGWQSGSIPQEASCNISTPTFDDYKMQYQYMSSHRDRFRAFFRILHIVIAAVLALTLWDVICRWLIFAKAGRPGWATLIPIYRTYVLIKAAAQPWWWVILWYIPLANLAAHIVADWGIAKNFGKGAGFAAGLFLLPPVFYPILAFGRAEYETPAIPGIGQGVKRDQS